MKLQHGQGGELRQMEGAHWLVSLAKAAGLRFFSRKLEPDRTGYLTVLASGCTHMHTYPYTYIYTTNPRLNRLLSALRALTVLPENPSSVVAFISSDLKPPITLAVGDLIPPQTNTYN